MKKAEHKDLISNRKARFNYELLETFEAGMQLLGSEIKSLRNHEGSLQEAFISIKKNELFLINASIPPYKFGSHFNPEERRERKLLMHTREIQRLKKLVQEKGISLIPLGIYLKKGWAKIRFAVAKGKKNYDKRAKLKEKEIKKKIAKEMKQNI